MVHEEVEAAEPFFNGDAGLQAELLPLPMPDLLRLVQPPDEVRPYLMV